MRPRLIQGFSQGKQTQLKDYNRTEHECVDAVLAPDFDNLAAILPTRWLFGKGNSRLLARSRLGGICAMDHRSFRSIRTKDEAIIGPESRLREAEFFDRSVPFREPDRTLDPIWRFVESEIGRQRGLTAHPRRDAWVAMQVQTKFLRLFRKVAIGDHIDGWRVCWIGGWHKCRVLFVVMVERPKPSRPMRSAWRASQRKIDRGEPPPPSRHSVGRSPFY
jgi:hypothetical protein